MAKIKFYLVPFLILACVFFYFDILYDSAYKFIDTDWSNFYLVLLIYFLHLVFSAIRWALIAYIGTGRKERLFQTSFLNFFGAAFLNQVGFSSISGDIFKAHQLHRHNITKSEILDLIYFEKAQIILSHLTIISASLGYFLLVNYGWGGAICVFLFFLAATTGVVNAHKIVKLFVRSSSTRRKLYTLVGQLKTYRNLTQQFGHWAILSGILSLVLNLCLCLAFFLTLDIKLDIGLQAEVIAVLPLIIFGASLPISIAGWGVREFLSASFLVGIAMTDAVAVSLLVGFFILLTRLPGLLVLCVYRRY